MKRILVLGSPGAGKSTFAIRLGQKLELPVFHMDALFWKRGWVESSDSEMAAKLKEVVKGKSWVIDGNYSRFLDTRLRRADTLIYLDLSKWICRWRVIKRWLTWGGRQRPDMALGCPEKMDWEFFMWVWNFDRSETLSKISEFERKLKVICLRNPREVSKFLKNTGVESD